MGTETLPDQKPRAHADPGAVARPARRPVVLAVVFGLVALAVLAAYEIRVGVSFKDEGYLWYGVQRTYDGELPILDFRSYDPGRYWWSAAWYGALGEGILSLRIAVWLFAALGLVAGLMVLRRVVHSLGGLLASAAGLTAWMHPRHKRFDFVLPLVAILAAVRMIERRDTPSHVLAGVVTGAAAWSVGRNHGLYLAVGMTAIVWFIAPPRRWGFVHRFAQMAGGALLGYLPMWLLLAFRPGFLEAFVQSNLDLIRHGTNKGLPIPWPWRGSGLDEVFLGLLLIVVPLTYLATAAWLLRRRRHLSGPYEPLLLAATAVGLPYLHHAFDRADANHAYQAMAPFVVLVVTFAVWAWHRHRRRLAAAVVAAAVVFSVVLPVRDWDLYGYLTEPHAYRPAQVASDTLLLGPHARGRLRVINRFHELVGDDAFLVTSNDAGVYATLQRRAPVHDTYMTRPRDSRRQAEFLRDLEDNDVGWAIIMSMGRLRDTHPRVAAHIHRTWDRVDVDWLPSPHRIYRRP